MASDQEREELVNASVVLAALDQMLEPWGLHPGAHKSALLVKIRRLRDQVANQARVVEEALPTRHKIAKMLFVNAVSDDWGSTAPEIATVCYDVADAVLALFPHPEGEKK